MTETPTLAKLLQYAVENRLLEVHTALIAKVENYDANKQLVDVSPVLTQPVRTSKGEWYSETLPVLCDVLPTINDLVSRALSPFPACILKPRHF